MGVLTKLVERYKYKTIVTDVMLVAWLPLLVTLSRWIRYMTVQFVPKWTSGELANAIKM